MGVHFVEVTPGFKKITYQIVPELPPPDFQVDEIKSFKSVNMEGDGYSKDKAKRLIGIVPYSVLYNYALAHGIKGTAEMNMFYESNNKRNMINLLNEFTAFRMVDQL